MRERRHELTLPAREQRILRIKIAGGLRSDKSLAPSRARHPRRQGAGQQHGGRSAEARVEGLSVGAVVVHSVPQL